MWLGVTLQAVEALPRTVALEELKASPKLAQMGVCRRGNPLSIQPVAPAEFAEVLRVSKRKPSGVADAS